MTTSLLTSEQAEADRAWVVVDAAGQTVGRLASKVATILRGKNKVNFAPHQDNGDFVVVINCAQVRFTGNKLAQKKYYNYSGYVGGLKEITAEKLLQENPCDVVKRAVKGMIPHGPLGYKIMNKLKTFANGEHPHQAQVRGSDKAKN
jgi:large subunit ribosomal protein L13